MDGAEFFFTINVKLRARFLKLGVKILSTKLVIYSLVSCRICKIGVFSFKGEFEWMIRLYTISIKIDMTVKLNIVTIV